MTDHFQQKPIRLRRASVKDVAAAAGVSVATVSRSFNMPETVRAEVRDSVLRAANSLGYSPNPSAKALRLQRTGIAGAVFPSTAHGIYASMLTGFQTEMSRERYLTVLMTVGFDNRNILEPVRQLVEHGAEALMIVGEIEDDRMVAYLKQAGIPVVCTYSKLPGNPFLTAGIDNYQAIVQVVDYLYSVGHRRFAMISGPVLGNDRQRARKQAFIDCMHARGIEGPPLIYESIDHESSEFAVSVVHALREQHPEVTALVCSGDQYGIAAIHTAHQMGLRVPEDLSITGFDDQSYAALTIPTLTTVSVPGRQMGEQAARAVLQAINQGNPIRHLCLETPLMIRGSSGPAPTR